MHSKAPTKEIKLHWVIFAIGVTFMLFMGILTGQYGFKFPFTTEINNNGGIIFFFFIVLFCIMSIKTKKPLNTKT